MLGVIVLLHDPVFDSGILWYTEEFKVDSWLQGVLVPQPSNMLTEACRVWDVALGFFAVSPCIAQSDLWVNLLGSPPLRICLDCFPLVNNLSFCRMMDSIASLRSLLMSFPPWRCVNTWSECSRPSKGQNFWFRRGGQLINVHSICSTRLLLTLLILIEAVSVDLYIYDFFPYW